MTTSSHAWNIFVAFINLVVVLKVCIHWNYNKLLVCWWRASYTVPRVNKILSVNCDFSLISLPNFRWIRKVFWSKLRVSKLTGQIQSCTLTEIVYDCFHTTTAEFGIGNRDHIVHKVKQCVPSDPLQKRFASPWHGLCKGWYCSIKKHFCWFWTCSLTHSLFRAKKLKFFLTSYHPYSEINKNMECANHKK